MLPEEQRRGQALSPGHVGNHTPRGVRLLATPLTAVIVLLAQILPQVGAQCRLLAGDQGLALPHGCWQAQAKGRVGEAERRPSAGRGPKQRQGRLPLAPGLGCAGHCAWPPAAQQTSARPPATTRPHRPVACTSITNFSISSTQPSPNMPRQPSHISEPGSPPKVTDPVTFTITRGDRPVNESGVPFRAMRGLCYPSSASESRSKTPQAAPWSLPGSM